MYLGGVMVSLVKLSSVVCGAAILVACGTTQQTTSTSVTGVNRTQKFSVASETVNAEASKAYSQVLVEAHNKKRLNTDANMVARVTRITKNLVGKTGYIRKDAMTWPWEVHVITSDEINAWCMPQGKMVIYSGIINQLRLTDAEIAQIMAHEISHALREHSREQMSRRETSNVITNILGAVGQAYGIYGVNQVASLGADLGFNLPFSRTHEIEADLLGMELAARAGYNPDSAATLWEKMLASETAGTPEFLSSHPNSDTRRETLQANANKVRPLYLAAVKQ